MKRKIIIIFLISVLLISLVIAINIDSFSTCEQDSNKILCNNYITGHKTLTVTSPKILQDGKWKNPDKQFKIIDDKYSFDNGNYNVFVSDKSINIYSNNDMFSIKTKTNPTEIGKDYLVYDISDSSMSADLKYTFLENSIEKLIIIYSMDSNSKNKKLSFVEDFDSINNSGKIKIDEDLIYWDSKQTKDIKNKIISQGNGKTIIEIDSEYLKTAIFPIYIDPSLTIDSSTELCGLQEYDDVTIQNGATVTVCAYNGTAGTGILNFSVSGTFTLESGATINGNGKGYRGGYYVSNIYYPAEGIGFGGANGGGAGYGSIGGNSGSSSLYSFSAGIGGINYNNNTENNVSIGSGGAGGDYTEYSNGANGGIGGALISIIANNIDVHGVITSDGQSGSGSAQRGWAGGGGSGGGILLWGLSINISYSSLTIIGGNGGNKESESYPICGGGGGSGGRIKIIHAGVLSNESATITLNGGSAGVNSASCATTNPTAGGSGTIYYLSDSTLFNLPPKLTFNETIPSSFTFGEDNIYLNVTAFDNDNDSISAIYFNLTMPNSTNMFYDNGFWIAGNSSIGENETWESPRFNISNVTGHVGIWNWFALIVSDGASANATYSDSFTLNDDLSPSISLILPEENSTYYRNVSIPLNFTATDNIEIDSCWYSIDNGATTQNIPGCNNIVFGISEGVFNITLYANDTSGNTVLQKNQNISFSCDNISPNIEINKPSGVVAKTFYINFTTFDLGGDVNCNFTIKTSVGGDTGVNNIFMPGCSEVNQTLSVDGDYIIYAQINDSTGNINSTNQTFSVDTNIPVVSSGGGGGGGSIIQQITSTIKSSVCDDTLPAFDEALSNFWSNRTWENFKQMWFAYWDYSLCKQSASIIPVDIEKPAE